MAKPKTESPNKPLVAFLVIAATDQGDVLCGLFESLLAARLQADALGQREIRNYAGSMFGTPHLRAYSVSVVMMVGSAAADMKETRLLEPDQGERPVPSPTPQPEDDEHHAQIRRDIQNGGASR